MSEIGIFPPRYYLINSAACLFGSSYHHEHLLKGIIAAYTFSTLIILTLGNQKSSGIGKNIAVLVMFYDNIGRNGIVRMNQAVDKCFSQRSMRGRLIFSNAVFQSERSRDRRSQFRKNFQIKLKQISLPCPIRT